METKHNKPNLPKDGISKMNMSKTKAKMDDVRDFTKRLTMEKKELLENSFEEVKKLTNDLENLKLQNEELEIVLNDIMKEKYKLQDSHDVLNNSYEALLEQYTETKKLLHDSHDQNVQLSEILEKMRENERCLVAETHKLRKYGSIQDSTIQSDFFGNGTITNLEKEVKFWQREAEKLSKIIELNDKKLSSGSTKQLVSNKKNSKQMKRYNRVISRSHSVEESQRKSKECEFEKIKNEKVQMKHLLNDLESQVLEIQNNVVKISDERQKYKEFYFLTKDKMEQTENINVNLERRICDLSNENCKFSVESINKSKELEAMIEDNEHIRRLNEGFIKEISMLKIQHENEIKSLESKMSSLMKENHDIGVRSINLKSSIVALESDFKSMEDDLQNKCSEAKENLITISTMKTELLDTKKKLQDKSDSQKSTNGKLCTLEDNFSKLKKSEEQQSEKLEVKKSELIESRKREMEKEEIIKNMKISFSAQIIKMENHMQNAEQIISSKIKLITSLELKVSNNEQELKSKDEEIINLKRSFNSKQHELEVLEHEYVEASDGNKYLKQQVENLSSNSEAINSEVNALNEVLNETKKSLEFLNHENKKLKDILHAREDQISITDTQIEKNEKEILIKSEEIMRYKKIVIQLQNEVEQKESHIGSLLSILESKEEKIMSIQSCNTKNEIKMKEYMGKLSSYDDYAIQSTSRENALEKEIENLNNNAIRLSKQKDNLGQMLTARNKTIGQLQAQLGEKNEGRYRYENVNVSVNDIPMNSQEHSFAKSLLQRQDMGACRKNNYDPEITLDVTDGYLLQQNGVNIRSSKLCDNYDQSARRHRAQSHNGRSQYVIEAV